VIDCLIEDIEAAAISVHLLVYIFADDVVGTRVAEALGRARARGVEVRVMFDPVGSRPWRRGTLKLLARYDVRVQEALPFRLWRYRTRRDMRNHRKLFVVDERIGYVGSQNIVTKDFRPGIVNRELTARVTGPIVASLATVVRGDWTLEAGEQPADPVTISEPAGDAVAQLLPSSRDYPLQGFETMLVWQLHQATRHAVIVTPYFIPDEALLSAMRTAALRGVTVDLVLSEVIDQRLVHLAQSSYYDEVLAAGVRIWLFRHYLLHAKNVSVDGTFAVVGSSNVDLRSFQLNEEASLLLYDAASVTGVETIQQGYIDVSDRLLPNEWAHRSPARKLLENCARLISSLL
jgi:cardiolipin synthase